jgi:predicted site-specific integrase-resolvase
MKQAMSQISNDTSAQKSLFKAVKYVRMSTEHQQYSTENQSDKLYEYANKRGIEIIRTYADEGKSGLRIEGIARTNSYCRIGPSRFSNYFGL